MSPNIYTDLNGRLQLYGLLATAFYEPTKETCQNFLNPNYWQKVSLAFRRTCRGQEDLTKDMASLFFHQDEEPLSGNQLEELLRRMRVEYNRLFIGPAPPPCPPYESVYHLSRPKEELGTVFGPPTLAMEKALREEKLAIALDHTQLADHIALELEFMYYLLKRSSLPDRQRKVYAEKARLFFTDHLISWMPEFGEKLTQNSRHPFYEAVGKLLTSFLQAEEKYVYNTEKYNPNKNFPTKTPVGAK